MPDQEQKPTELDDIRAMLDTSIVDLTREFVSKMEAIQNQTDIRNMLGYYNPALTRAYVAQMEARKSQRPDAPAQDALFEAVATVTKRTPPNGDWTLLSDIEFAVLAKVAKELRKVQATPEQVHAFPFWYATRKDKRPIEPWTLPKFWVSFLADQGHTSITITIREA